MTAQAQRRRLGDFGLQRIYGEFRLGTYELEATMLSHCAAPAIATHEKTCAKALLAGMNGDFIVRGLEARDPVAAPDLDSDGERVSGEDALEMLHFDPQLAVGRAR